ncbi:MAG: hypothetical protein LBH25_15360 [Fibromonadaceae bacterium]|jgi:hypothetical protein|nr:hypothetical protein [Fibromonadaceae bacterium]
MNYRFLKKIALAVSVMLAMTFTLSCSDDKDDNKKEAKPKWCIAFGKTSCMKIGAAEYKDGKLLTEEDCATMNGTVTEEAPDKSKCILLYDDGVECTNAAGPCPK